MSERAERPLALGIVGCGRIMRLRHVRALEGVDEVDVVAVADPDAGARAHIAAAFGGVPEHDELAGLLSEPLLDAVAVCVPAESHAELVVAALVAGKHVFVEKPLCLSLTEAELIRRTVEETGRTLTVGFNLRHHPLVRDAAKLVHTGALGEVVALQSVFSSSFDYRDDAHAWRFSRARGGGALIEMASHHFDLWRMLLRDEVDEVVALVGSGEDEDATAAVAATTRRGVAVSHLVTQRSTNVNECLVYGTRRTLRLSPYRFDGLELQSTTDFAGSPLPRLRRLVSSLPALRRTRDAYVESYREQWRHFAGATRTGRPEPNVEDGLRNVELLVAVSESAALRAPVRVGAGEGARA